MIENSMLDASSAVLDESILAIAYSGTKQSTYTPEASKADSDPLQILRVAMSLLESVKNDNENIDTFDQIQTLLQGVEEYFVENNRLQSSVKLRLATKFSNIVSSVDEGYSRLGDACTPMIKQKSIVMENQLDLNESEIDYYEDIVNDLAERLEKMKEERDELQFVSNALGERLQRLTREKEEELFNFRIKVEELETSCESKIKELTLRNTETYSFHIDENTDSQSTSDHFLSKLQALVAAVSENSKFYDVDSDFTGNSTTSFETPFLFLERYITKSTENYSRVAQENIDMKFQIEAMNGKIQSKSTANDQLYHELQETRKQLDFQSKLIDELRLQNLKFKADSQINDASLDNQIELLKTYCKNLENKAFDFGEQIRLKDIELANERERSQSFITLVEKLGEKDDTTEELVEKLKNENLVLKVEMMKLQDLLTSKLAEIELLHSDCKEIEKEGVGMIEDNYLLSERFSKCQSELTLLKESISFQAIDYTSKLTLLTKTIDELQCTNYDTQQIVESKQNQLDNTVSELNRTEFEKNNIHICMTSAMTMVRDFCHVILTKVQNLEISVNHSLSNYSTRMSSLHSQMNQIKRSMEFYCRDGLSMQQALEVSLKESQDLLANALNKHLDDEVLINNLKEHVKSIQFEYVNCEKVLREVQSKSHYGIENDQDNRNDTFLMRLADAEQRSEQMALDQAKHFAQSSRVIAYLEGENSRLKSLSDHFRIANAKLMVELKNSLVSELRLRGMENKMSSITDKEEASTKRIKSFEEILQKRNEEYTLSISSKQQQYQHNLDQIHEEVADLKSRNTVLDNALIKLTVERDGLEKKFSSAQEEINQLIRQHRAKCDEFENHNLLTKSKLEDYDYECKLLKERVQEMSYGSSQCDMKICILNEEILENKATFDRVVSDLSLEIEEKAQKINFLELEVISAKAKLIEAESNSLHISEEMSKSLLKRVGNEEQIRCLKESVEFHKAESSKMMQVNSALKMELHQTKVNLDTSVSKLSRLEEVELPSSQEKIRNFEITISNLEESLRVAHTELQTFKVTIEKSSVALFDAEREIESLQEKLNALCTKEQLLRTSNESICEDYQISQIRIGSLVEKLQGAEEKVAGLQNEISQVRDSYGELENQSLKENRQRKIIESQLKSIELLLSNYNQRFSEITIFLQEAINQNYRSPLLITDSIESDSELVPILRDSFRNVEEFLQVLNMVLSSTHQFQIKISEEAEEMDKLRKINDSLKLTSEQLRCENEELNFSLETCRKEISLCDSSLSNAQAELSETISKIFFDSDSNRKLFNDKLTWLQKLTADMYDRCHGVIDLRSHPTDYLRVKNFDDLIHPETFSYPLASAFCTELEVCLSFLMNFVESVFISFNNSRKECNDIRLVLESKELDWKEQHYRLCGDLSDALAKDEVHAKTINELEVVVEEQASKLADMSNAIEEISKNNLELEQEFHITADLNIQLKNSVFESESLINELRLIIKSHETNIESKSQLMISLQDQLGVFRKRTADFESLNEKNQVVINRLKFEKDALDNVRKSLELDVQRYEQNKNQLLEEVSQSTAREKSVLELESAVCIILSTISQIEEQLDLKNIDVIQNVSLSSESNISLKVNLIIEKLSNVRTIIRDESKTKKQLESKLISGDQDIGKLNDAVQKLRSCLRNVEEENSSKSSMLTAANSEVEKLSISLNKALLEKTDVEKELQFYRQNNDNLSKQLSEAHTELESKNSDLKALQYELGLRDNSVSRLREELALEQSSQKSLLSELDQKSSQYDTVLNNNQTLLLTIQHLEQSLSIEKDSKLAVENSLKELDDLKVIECELNNEISNVRFQLQKVIHEKQQLVDVKLSAEKTVSQLEQELMAAKKHSSLIELRMDMILQEKSSFIDEISETRRKIQLAKENFEIEKEQRLKSEATAEALKRVHGEDRKKLLIEMTSLQTASSSNNTSKDEELYKLKSKIQQCQLDLDERDTRIGFLQQERNVMLKELSAAQSMLNRKSDELLAATTYSNNLRSEGKYARKKIAEMLGLIKELLQLLNVDLKSKVTTTDDNFNASASNFELIESSVSLWEALGLQEFFKFFELFHESFSSYRTEFRRLKTMVMQLDSTGTENMNIKRKCQDLERSKIENESRYVEQLRSLQQQISQLKNIETQYLQATHQISSLESIITKEKESKEQVLSQLSSAKTKLIKLDSSNAKVGDNSLLLKEIETMKFELQNLSTANQDLTQEIEAINFHRTILKNTIEEVEHNISSRIELFSEGVSEETDHDKTKKELIRYKVKTRSLEEIANVYRTGILALYSDGTSYSAAQFGWQPFTSKTDEFNMSYIMPGVGWIEKEISIIQKSFQSELRVLNDFADDLFTKLKYSQRYCLELRKQFEDHMKAIYSVGKDSSTSMIIRQLEKMRMELEENQKLVFSLEDDLHLEHSRAQSLHNSLVHEISLSLQGRDAALIALKNLEIFCKENNFPIGNHAGIYEALKNHYVVANNFAEVEQSRAPISDPRESERMSYLSIKRYNEKTSDIREIHSNSSYMLKTLEPSRGISTLRVSRSKHK